MKKEEFLNTRVSFAKSGKAPIERTPEPFSQIFDIIQNNPTYHDCVATLRQMRATGGKELYREGKVELAAFTAAGWD